MKTFQKVLRINLHLFENLLVIFNGELISKLQFITKINNANCLKFLQNVIFNLPKKKISLY